MGSRRLALCLALALCAPPLCLAAQGQARFAPAGGALDLGAWQPEIDFPVELKDGWRFAWNRLLAPADLEGMADPLAGTRPLSATVRWSVRQSGYPDLPAHGAGSYFIKLRLPERHPPLGLELRRINSAALVLLGDRELAAVGQPALAADATRETPRRLLVPLPDGVREAWLVVQVANWSDANPGLELAPRIGALAELQADRDRSVAFTFVTAGLYLVMGAYHVFLFLFRRRERSPLWFAAICLLLCVRVLVTDDLYLSLLFPAADLRVFVWGSYLSFSLLTCCFVFFITNLFRFRFNAAIRWAAGLGCGLFSALVLISPLPFITGKLWLMQVLILILAALMLAVLFAAILRRRPNAVLFLSGFACVVAAVVHDILKYHFQWESPNLTPYGTIGMVFVQSLVLTRRTTLSIETAENLGRRLRRANEAMLRFVPREVLSQLERGDITELRLGDHKRREMAVMFADIVGFSRISERLSPESTFQLINRFLTLMGPIVRGHGGFVDKYLGDGVLALFPESADKAVAAAVAMQKAMAKINLDQDRPGAEPIRMGIGIHYGTVMIGTIGEPQRMDSTVIADAVNLASRLQDLTRSLGGQVLVSAECLARIERPEQFNYRQLGVFKVHNRQESVAVADFFDSEGAGAWELKRRTKRDFERAVKLFQANRLAEAGAAFRELAAAFPGDAAARYYLDRIGQLSEHE